MTHQVDAKQAREPFPYTQKQTTAQTEQDDEYSTPKEVPGGARLDTPLEGPSEEAHSQKPSDKQKHRRPFSV